MRLPVLTITVLLLLGAAGAQSGAESLYKSRCAQCHGENGSGRTVAGRKLNTPDLRLPKVQNLSDEQMFQTIAEGREHHNYPHVFRAMGVADEDIRILVRYVRELAAKK